MYRSRAKRRVMRSVLETGDLGMIKNQKECAPPSNSWSLVSLVREGETLALDSASAALGSSRGSFFMQAHMSQLTRGTFYILTLMDVSEPRY